MAFWTGPGNLTSLEMHFDIWEGDRGDLEGTEGREREGGEREGGEGEGKERERERGERERWERGQSHVTLNPKP